MAKPALKAEAIRMRKFERRSIAEIQNALGVSRATVSLWVRPYRLTDVEIARRRSSQVGVPHARTAELRAHEYSILYRVVKSKRLKGPQIAKVAETAVMLRLLAHGFNVYGSMFDGERSDWIVETPEGALRKLQVKTARQGNVGVAVVSLTHGGAIKNGKRPRARYECGDFDFIVGYEPRSDIAYVWAWSEVKMRRSGISIHKEAREAWHKVK